MLPSSRADKTGASGEIYSRGRDVKEIIQNSSLLFKFLTGRRCCMIAGFYIKNIQKNLQDGFAGQVNEENSIDSFYYKIIKEYGKMLYSRKHKHGTKKISKFMNGISYKRQRIMAASNILTPAIVKAFPELLEISVRYYEKLSPETDFTALFKKSVEKTTIDADTSRRLFIEILNSAEPSSSWARKIRSLSYELYGNNSVYLDQFAVYIAYAVFKKCNHNISCALWSMYRYPPFQICRIIMEDTENAEDLLWHL